MEKPTGSKTTTRHGVTFRAQDPERYASSYDRDDLIPTDVWYTPQEYEALKKDLLKDAQACTDPTALAWLQTLSRQYRQYSAEPTPGPLLWAQWFGPNAKQQHESTSYPIVDAWFLGLEQYILANVTLRESRRCRLGRQLRKNAGKPLQCAAASQKESKAVIQWNNYIGRCIAHGVVVQQQQQEHDEQTS